jgi:hypothetical protein
MKRAKRLYTTAFIENIGARKAFNMWCRSDAPRRTAEELMQGLLKFELLRTPFTMAFRWGYATARGVVQRGDNAKYFSFTFSSYGDFSTVCTAVAEHIDKEFKAMETSE